jgi:hypothetical protein
MSTRWLGRAVPWRAKGATEEIGIHDCRLVAVTFETYEDLAAARALAALESIVIAQVMTWPENLVGHRTLRAETIERPPVEWTPRRRTGDVGESLAAYHNH